MFEDILWVLLAFVILFLFFAAIAFIKWVRGRK
ncbi:unknown [Firmicutes bacterium CAG:822]|nr:unknown [Firmicutes bacterium CAG:822]